MTTLLAGAAGSTQIAESSETSPVPVKPTVSTTARGPNAVGVGVGVTVGVGVAVGVGVGVGVGVVDVVAVGLTVGVVVGGE
jgi:hypothetical protein